MPPFVIGDTGEQFITAEWYPDPKVLEAEILQMANAFGDWTEPLLEARAAMIEDTRIHFESETDPYRFEWEKLDEDYWHDKVEVGGFPDHILVRTGALEKAATGEEAWFVDERSIFFNAAALPPYGPIHQDGTRGGIKGQRYHKAAGKRTGLTAKDLKILQGSGRGLDLPQRMFIGADVDTIEEIEGIFLRHLENTVTREWSGGGGQMPMGENALGRFPIISFTSRGQPILRTPHGPRFGRFIR